MSDIPEDKPSPTFFLFKGDAFVIHYRSVKKWRKGEYFNTIRNVYTIELDHFDNEHTTIEYHDEKARDVEYENFIEKYKEFDYIFM